MFLSWCFNGIESGGVPEAVILMHFRDFLGIDKNTEENHQLDKIDTSPHPAPLQDHDDDNDDGDEQLSSGAAGCCA
ncbi:hypothetical protein ACFX1Q_031792 [Malus domestica]